MSEPQLMLEWVFIPKPRNPEDTTTKMYCTLCKPKTKGEYKLVGDNVGHSNLHVHLRRHPTWKDDVATAEHKQKYAEVKTELAAKRQRDGECDAPAPKKGPVQTNIDSKWTKRPEPCSDELLARMFCTAPIPFRFLNSSSEFRQCFNTNMDDVKLKEFFTLYGEKTLPSNIVDASGFCDIGTINRTAFFDVGVHNPATSIHNTFMVEVLDVGKEAAALKEKLNKYFADCDARNIDIIAMTADNASNVQGTNAEDEELQKVPNRVFKEHYAFKLACWPHTVQLGAHDVEDLMTDVIAQMKEVCDRFENLPDVGTLPHINDTRWWSLYERALRTYTIVCAEGSKHESFFNDDEAAVFEAYLQIFLPLRSFGKICETATTTALECINGFFVLMNEFHS